MLRRVKVGDDGPWSSAISVIGATPTSESPQSTKAVHLRDTRRTEEDKHIPGIRHLLLKVGICLLYVVGLHNTVSTIFKCTSTRQAMEVLDAVSVACRTLFGAVTSHLYYRNYPSVARFLARDRKQDPGLYQAWNCSKTMQRKRWLAVGFVALYGVAMAIQQCVWLLAYGPVAYFRSQVYGLDPVALRLPSILVVLVAILDFTAYNLSVLVPAACIVHYVGICDLIVLKGERFRSALQCCSALGSDGLKAASVRKLQASYSALLEAVQYLDERLRSAIFFWYVDTVLNIVVSVRSVQHTLAHFNPYAAAGAYVHGAYLVTAFLLVSLSAANLVAQRRHIYRDMCRLVCGIGADDDNLCNQVMLLQEDISNGELAFTGWNCFVIDRPFILSVTGAVITYAVVLQQLT